MRPAWPERIVGLLFICEVVVIAWFMATSRTAGTLEQVGATASALPHFLFGALITLGPLWVAMRLLDWLFAGPARRKSHLTARFSP